MSAFDALAAKLAKRPGVRDPKGLAYSIGVKANGKSAMTQAAANKESVQAVLRKRHSGK